MNPLHNQTINILFIVLHLYSLNKITLHEFVFCKALQCNKNVMRRIQSIVTIGKCSATILTEYNTCYEENIYCLIMKRI